MSAMCEKRFQYLRQLPYSLARCRDRQHMQGAMEEFNRLPAAKRHRVAAFFFSDDALASDCKQYIESGQLTRRLASELGSIEQMPLTEEVIEAPHGAMQREKLRQRASSRVWQAVTSRLADNLRMYDAFDVETRALFATEWRRAKRILQVDPKRALRPMRISWKELKLRVYRCSLDVPRFSVELPAIVDAPAAGKTTVTAKIGVYIEYLRATLEPQKFYTIDAEPDKMIFQVVWIVPPTIKVIANLEEDPCTLEIALLKHEVWASPNASDEEFDVYPLDDVERCDLMKVQKNGMLIKP